MSRRSRRQANQENHHPADPNFPPALATALLTALNPNSPAHCWAQLANTLYKLQSSQALHSFLEQKAQLQSSNLSKNHTRPDPRTTTQNNQHSSARPPPLCRFWLRGKCTHNPCRFTHLPPRTWRRPASPKPNPDSQAKSPSPKQTDKHPQSTPRSPILPDLNHSPIPPSFTTPPHIPNLPNGRDPSQPLPSSTSAQSPPSIPRSTHPSHSPTHSKSQPGDSNPASPGNVFAADHFPHLSAAEQLSQNIPRTSQSLLGRFVDSFRTNTSRKRKARSRSLQSPTPPPSSVLGAPPSQ